MISTTSQSVDAMAETNRTLFPRSEAAPSASPEDGAGYAMVFRSAFVPSFQINVIRNTPISTTAAA